MTLLDICEPLFQYVCRINRAGRKKGNMDYAVARAEVKGLFDEIRSKAAGDARLKSQFKAVELPLQFFVDSMIAESNLPFAQKWHKNRLAYDSNELAGDEKFFDLLEETLKDSSDEASERLSIYYTGIGLGFTGWYFGQPEYLRKKMLEISPRIRAYLQADTTARICGEAYEHTDVRNLIQPPSRMIGVIAIFFFVLLITTLVCNVYLFQDASKQLTDSLQQVIRQDKTLGQ